MQNDLVIVGDALSPVRLFIDDFVIREIQTCNKKESRRIFLLCIRIVAA